jgi:hypothetical protein
VQVTDKSDALTSRAGLPLVAETMRALGVPARGDRAHEAAAARGSRRSRTSDTSTLSFSRRGESADPFHTPRPRLIRRTIEEPLRQIVENAGEEGSIVVQKLKDGKSAFGYNAQTNAYGDLLAQGVIDPVKVVRTALENAASVAAVSCKGGRRVAISKGRVCAACTTVVDMAQLAEPQAQLRACVDRPGFSNIIVSLIASGDRAVRDPQDSLRSDTSAAHRSLGKPRGTCRTGRLRCSTTRRAVDAVPVLGGLHHDDRVAA